MDITRQKYLFLIMQDFMKYGIKSVTMDDISKNLGISKKTLYKYFKDKDDIVCTLMEMDIESELELLQKIVSTSGNAIDETYSFADTMVEKLKVVNPSLLYDMEKYHPKAWQIFINHKRVDVYHCIKSNIERGMREGLYRKDLNPEIVAKLYSEKIDMLFNKELFPLNKFTLEQIHTEMLSYHLHGIVSKKGLNYLKVSE